ncbi:MAG TPA: hypothetical protein VG253_25965 [Streptosporangiaceae bacterium]|jgi:hypothetical protein|nr:hypothetical protein [Streptosporangiaceae bacterium]
MTGLVWLNFPLAALIFAGIVGVPLWLTFRRPETGPDHSQAWTYCRTRAQHLYGAATPAGQRPSTGVTAARQHAAPHAPVPGRRHSSSGQPVPGRAHAHDTQAEPRRSA